MSMNRYTVVINDGSPREVLAASPRVAVQHALKHVPWPRLMPGYSFQLRVTVANREKVVRCYMASMSTVVLYDLQHPSQPQATPGYSNRPHVHERYVAVGTVPPGWYLTKQEALKAVAPHGQ